jgi:hypothetical protein
MSFSPSFLVLQSATNLNSGVVSHFEIPDLTYDFISSTEVEFVLSENDLNQIKVISPKIGLNVDNTFISSKGSFVNDTSQNPIGIISNSSAISATQVIPDNIRPELRAFTLNMNDGTVIFSFTETVVPGTFNLSGVVLAVSNTGGKHHTLQKEQSVISVDGPEIKVKLTASDVEALAKDKELAKSQESTFISFRPSFVQDTNGFPVKEILLNNGKKAFEFIQDETDPSITGFDLDMDSGMVKLKFDEVMKLESFRRQLLTLQNLVRNPTESFNLKSDN